MSNEKTLPINIFNKDKRNIIIIIEQYDERLQAISESSRDMMFEVISKDENNNDLFKVLYRDKDIEAVLNIIKAKADDENNSVNLFMSGIVCNMTDLLQDLVTETTTLSKLNRIKIIHCFESSKGVRKKIEQLGPSKIENIEYDVERFHTFPDYDYRFEVLEQIFEIQYTPELEK